MLQTKSINLTFKEGKSITDYAELISKETNISKEEQKHLLCCARFQYTKLYAKQPFAQISRIFKSKTANLFPGKNTGIFFPDPHKDHGESVLIKIIRYNPISAKRHMDFADPALDTAGAESTAIVGIGLLHSKLYVAPVVSEAAIVMKWT